MATDTQVLVVGAGPVGLYRFDENIWAAHRPHERAGQSARLLITFFRKNESARALLAHITMDVVAKTGTLADVQAFVAQA